MSSIIKADKVTMSLIMSLYHYTFANLPVPERKGVKVDYRQTIHHLKCCKVYINRLNRYAKEYQSISVQEQEAFIKRYKHDAAFYRQNSMTTMNCKDSLIVASTYQFFSLIDSLYTDKKTLDMANESQRNMILQSKLFALIINYLPLTSLVRV